MTKNHERPRTHRERLIQAALMGVMVMYPYTLAFLVFLFLSAKLLVLHHWLGLLLSAGATFGVWVLRRVPR